MKKNKLKSKAISLFLVTVLVVSLIAYTKMSVKAELDEVIVYMTVKEIGPRSEIKEEDVAPRKISSHSIPPNVFFKKEDIVGKWTIQGFGLAPNSYLFKDVLVEKSNLPDAALLELEEGEVAVALTVDLETSYANSIIPDTRLDLNFKTTFSKGQEKKVLLGEFLKNVRVLAVKDSQASDVFTETGNSNTDNKNKAQSMAKIYIFAIPKEHEELFNKAKIVGEVYPVATDKTYNTELETELAENEILEYLKSVSYNEQQGENENGRIN